MTHLIPVVDRLGDAGLFLLCFSGLLLALVIFAYVGSLLFGGARDDEDQVTGYSDPATRAGRMRW